MDSLKSTSEDETLLKSGIRMYNGGLFPHALKAFEELIKKYPRSTNIDNARIWKARIKTRQYKYNDAIKELEVKKHQKDGLTGIPSGFTALDRLTSGWQRSDLIIIAARPGMGKTALVV